MLTPKNTWGWLLPSPATSKSLVDPVTNEVDMPSDDYQSAFEAIIDLAPKPFPMFPETRRQRDTAS